MRLTLKQIRVFLELSKCSSATQVAKELGLSQSAISMSTKEMENILGRPLFDRINKRMVLNEQGRVFYAEVEPLYRRLKDLENSFSQGASSGVIRVGGSQTVVDYLMPTVMCGFMNGYPDVKIQLKVGSSAQVSSWVSSGEIDIGFVEEQVSNSEFIKEKIADDELWVVTASTELAKQNQIKRLAEERWVLPEKGSEDRERFLSAIKPSVDALNIFFELSHTESIKSVLQNRKCLSCISKIALQKEIEEGKLFALKLEDFECKREIELIYRKDKFRSQLFEKFLHFARQRMAQQINEEYCCCV